MVELGIVLTLFVTVPLLLLLVALPLAYRAAKIRSEERFVQRFQDAFDSMCDAPTCVADVDVETPEGRYCARHAPPIGD